MTACLQQFEANQFYQPASSTITVRAVTFRQLPSDRSNANSDGTFLHNMSSKCASKQDSTPGMNISATTPSEQVLRPSRLSGQGDERSVRDKTKANLGQNHQFCICFIRYESNRQQLFLTIEIYINFRVTYAPSASTMKFRCGFPPVKRTYYCWLRSGR